MLRRLLSQAVRVLPAESRRVKVMSSMLSDAMLGLSVDNNFAGNITLVRNGLPVSSRENHGTGLISVMNTVNHYCGNLDISTAGNVFSVSIILYCNT